MGVRGRYVQIVSVVCADGTANVTRDGAPYASVAIPSGTTVPIDVISAISGGWNPDPDWGWDAVAALITDSDNGFSAIYACYPGFPNYVAFTATFVGTGEVDFGDGSAPQAVTSGVKIEHTLNYSGISQSVTSRGYKPCRIVFKSTGNFTLVYFDAVANPTNYQLYGTMPYVALKLRSQITTEFQYINYNGVASHLELIDFGTVLKVKLFNAFLNHYLLKKLTYNFENNTTTHNGLVLQNCPLFVDWNSIDFSNYTNLQSFWYYYIGAGLYALDIAIDNCTSIQGAWQYASIFSSIKLRNTGLVTNIAYAIYSNSSVMHFEMDDASAVTNTYLFIRTNGADNLQSLLLHGLQVGIDLTGRPLTATALNAFFTSLGTASGAQTIVVTGCIGAATCDTTIATAKGFTVTT